MASKKVKQFLAERPIAVHYPTGVVGHCKTLRNALVSSTRRLLHYEVDSKATIMYGEELIADVSVSLSKFKLHVQWRAEWAKQQANLW